MEQKLYPSRIAQVQTPADTGQVVVKASRALSGGPQAEEIMPVFRK